MFYSKCNSDFLPKELKKETVNKNEISKQQYLADLHKNVYIRDIVERYKLRDDVIIDSLTDVIYSSVGSLTNPHKLANTLGSVLGRSTSDRTIKIYLDYLVDSYLLASADRYDVKGKRYFNTIKKYYACDLGLRNARINFRQQERSHLMENMIYNELLRRGYRVDVGVVEVERMVDGKRVQSQYEIDFVVNGFTNGEIPDYQVSSLMMAIYFNPENQFFYLEGKNISYVFSINSTSCVCSSVW